MIKVSSYSDRVLKSQIETHEKMLESPNLEPSEELSIKLFLNELKAELEKRKG